jgi:ABC-type Mn2+/Zn2+ transport system permease subunit
MLNLLIEPLQYSFMQRGLAAAALAGVVCGVVGCFVVLRGLAFLGDALAHAILPGVAAAYLAGGATGPIFWGALAAALTTSLGIGALSRGGRLREDTAIGVTFAGIYAVGIALMSTIRSYSVDLAHILFGNILSVTVTDLLQIAGFGAAILLAVAAFYKELVVVSFDPVHAATLRLPAERLRYLLLILIAVTIVVALKVIGAGLMTALLITPAAAGYLLARRMGSMMLIAAGIGAGSGLIGLYGSYYLPIASGAAIALASTGCFALAWLWGRRRAAPLPV